MDRKDAVPNGTDRNNAEQGNVSQNEAAQDIVEDYELRIEEALDNKNYEDALYYANLVTEAGNYKYCNIIGNFYYDGTGVAQSFEKAVEYYRKGAEYGDAR